MKSAYLFRYRIAADTETACPNCKLPMRAGDRAWEIVDAPDRDDIGEAFESGHCSHACAMRRASILGYRLPDERWTYAEAQRAFMREAQ